MNSPVVRFGLIASVVATAVALSVAAPEANADVVGIAVMNTGSEGPVMGCPHTIGVGLSAPILSRTDIIVDGVSLPIRPDPTDPDGVMATWTPDRLGWHGIDAVQSQPGKRTTRRHLDIEVHRVGVNLGSSCVANGVPLPINPKTGTLGPFL